MNINRLRIVLYVVLTAGFFIFDTVMAHAGFLDKLNAATQALNQKAQQMQNPGASSTVTPGAVAGETDADHPLNLEDHFHGSCEGHRTATCGDYNEIMDQCMAPIYGYRMKKLGDRIEWKLKNEQLTDAQRKNLQEDLAGAREAEKNHSDDPTIAGEKKSQRYLSDISDEDQVWVNAEFMLLRNRIYNKCVGADHMGVGHRTEMVATDGPTGDEAVAEYRKTHHNRRRYSSSSASAGGCSKSVAGLRYKIMADMMEKKMKTLKLSDKERSDWEMDIAAVRTVAETGGLSMPTVPDPTNPYRPITRLSAPEEQTELNNEYVKESKTAMADCRQQ